jgi:hypothetical protein
MLRAFVSYSRVKNTTFWIASSEVTPRCTALFSMPTRRMGLAVNKTAAQISAPEAWIRESAELAKQFAYARFASLPQGFAIASAVA